MWCAAAACPRSSLHFTNDSHEGSHKRVLRFTFALPPVGAMEELAPLMALVPLCIDLVRPPSTFYI